MPAPQIRIYTPRRSTHPLVEGGTVVPKKGARIVWTNDGEFLVVTGFSKQSERTISVYRAKDLELLHIEVGSLPGFSCDRFENYLFEGDQRVSFHPDSLLRRRQLDSFPRWQGRECHHCLWGGQQLLRSGWFDDLGDKLSKYRDWFDFSRQLNVSKACKAFENLTENFGISHDR